MTKPLEVADSTAFQQNPANWAHCRWRLLAEGDSWFSIGDMNLFESANLLQALGFSSFTLAVQCAYPGDTLRRISQMRKDPNFKRLLTGNASWRWDAILLSAGGNDLIDALGSPPTSAPDKRLLRTTGEWGPAGNGPARYLSEAGWSTFRNYFIANLELIVQMRDSKGGPDGNAGRPICMHTYAYPTPRPSGAGLGQGPWLRPALVAYGIPEPDWPGLARLLLDRLRELLLSCAQDSARFPALFVFDSCAVSIDPALPGEPGRSGDWINEIHLTHQGCAKLAAGWGPAIETALLAHP